MPEEALVGKVGLNTRQADKAMRALAVLVKRFGRTAEQSTGKANRGMKALNSVMKQAQNAIRGIERDQRRAAQASERAAQAEKRRMLKLGQLRRRLRKQRTSREQRASMQEAVLAKKRTARIQAALKAQQRAAKQAGLAIIRATKQADRARERAAKAEEARIRKLGRLRRRRRKARVRREKRAIASIARTEERAAARRRARFAGLASLAVAGGAIGGVFLLGRFLKDSLQSFREFEKGLAEVSTILTITDKGLANLGDRLQSFSIAQGTNQADTIRAFYQVVSAGVTDAADAMLVLKASSDFAIAGLTDQETAVNIVTTTLNAYGFAARNAAFITDILFTTVRLGKTRAEELATTLGRIVGIAAAAGIALEELGAAVAVLTRVQPTEIAITSLRGLITGLISPSQKAAEQFEALGIKTDAYTFAADGLDSVLKDLALKTRGSAFQLTKLFENVRALSAVSVLATDGAEAFITALEEMENAAGASDMATEKMMNTTDFAMKQIGARWKEFKTTIGSVFGDVIVFLTGVNKGTIAGARAIGKFGDAFLAFQERTRAVGFTPTEARAGTTEEAFISSEELRLARQAQETLDEIAAASRKVQIIFKAAGDAGIESLRRIIGEQKRFIEAQDKSNELIRGLQEMDFSSLEQVFKGVRGQGLERVQEAVSGVIKLGEIDIGKIRKAFEEVKKVIEFTSRLSRERGGDPGAEAFGLRQALRTARGIGAVVKDAASGAEILAAIQKRLQESLRATGETIDVVNKSGQRFFQDQFVKNMADAERVTKAFEAAQDNARTSVERHNTALRGLRAGVQELDRLRKAADKADESLERFSARAEGERFERRLSRSSRKKQRKLLRRRVGQLAGEGKFAEAADVAKRLFGTGVSIRKTERLIASLEAKAEAALARQSTAAAQAQAAAQQNLITLRQNVLTAGQAANTAREEFRKAAEASAKFFEKVFKDAQKVGLILGNLQANIDTSEAEKSLKRLNDRIQQTRRELAKLNRQAGGQGRAGGGQVPGMASGGVVFAQRGLFTPRGTDTVPAMLTPGEMVINRAATSRNRSLLEAINKGQDSAGGTTIDTINLSINVAGANLSASDVAQEAVAALRAETVGTPGSFNPLTRNKST